MAEQQFAPLLRRQQMCDSSRRNGLSEETATEFQQIHENCSTETRHTIQKLLDLFIQRRIKNDIIPDLLQQLAIDPNQKEEQPSSYDLETVKDNKLRIEVIDDHSKGTKVTAVGDESNTQNHTDKLIETKSDDEEQKADESIMSILWNVWKIDEIYKDIAKRKNQEIMTIKEQLMTSDNFKRHSDAFKQLYAQYNAECDNEDKVILSNIELEDGYIALRQFVYSHCINDIQSDTDANNNGYCYLDQTTHQVLLQKRLLQEINKNNDLYRKIRGVLTSQTLKTIILCSGGVCDDDEDDTKQSPLEDARDSVPVFQISSPPEYIDNIFDKLNEFIYTFNKGKDVNQWIDASKLVRCFRENHVQYTDIKELKAALKKYKIPRGIAKGLHTFLSAPKPASILDPAHGTYHRQQQSVKNKNSVVAISKAGDTSTVDKQVNPYQQGWTYINILPHIPFGTPLHDVIAPDVPLLCVTLCPIHLAPPYMLTGYNPLYTVHSLSNHLPSSPSMTKMNGKNTVFAPNTTVTPNMSAPVISSHHIQQQQYKSNLPPSSVAVSTNINTHSQRMVHNMSGNASSLSSSSNNGAKSMRSKPPPPQEPLDAMNNNNDDERKYDDDDDCISNAQYAANNEPNKPPPPRRWSSLQFIAKYAHNTAIGNFYISDEIQQDIMDRAREYFRNTHALLTYFKQSSAMQIIDDQLIWKDNKGNALVILHIDLHFKNGVDMFLLAKPNDRESPKWKIVSLMTRKQINDEYGICALPESSREQEWFQNAINTAPTMEQQQFMTILARTNCKRLKKKGNKLNDNPVETIRISSQRFKDCIIESWNKKAIPIVVIKGNKIWIEWVKLIEIGNVNGGIKSVGISLKYFEENNQWNIVCLHCDLMRIYYQHQLCALAEDHPYFYSFEEHHDLDNSDVVEVCITSNDEENMNQN